MKVLHTSDWHLGIEFNERNRDEEFRQFLAWLLEKIKEEGVETLFIAGDIFDTYHPSVAAQTLYYNFLCDLNKQTICHNVVITSGNHDSISYLNAAKNILRDLNVYIVSGKPAQIEDEVLLLKDRDGQPQLIVCAVPYLRRGDLNIDSKKLSIEEENSEFLQAYSRHYVEVKQIAEARRAEFSKEIPVIYMGHMYVSGSCFCDKDHESIIGNLEGIGNLDIEESADYVALGHLHMPQSVLNRENWRYSGSPLHFSKSEIKGGSSKQSLKSVVIVNFEGRKAQNIELAEVPAFRDIRILQSDDAEELKQSLRNFIKENCKIWVFIDYSGKYNVGSNLSSEVQELVRGTQVKILTFKDEEWSKLAIQSYSLQSERQVEEIGAAEIFHQFIDKEAENESDELKNWMEHTCLELFEDIKNNRCSVED